LVRTLKERRVSVVAITEARLTGSDETSAEGYKVLQSGGQQHFKDVALVVCPALAACLIEWTAVSGRLLTARFDNRHGHLSIIVAYALTEVSCDAKNDSFYAQLESLTSHTPGHDNLIILGDMNAVTGCDRSGFEAVIGRHGSGVANDNTGRLLSLCASAGFSAMGSWFCRPIIRRWSWYSNDGHTVKEIDHIITRWRDRGLFKSYRVFRRAEAPASTNHGLVVVRIALTTPYTTSQRKPSGRVDTSRLTTDRGLTLDYAAAVQGRLDMLGDIKEDDVETMWGNLSGAITGAALDTIGPRRQSRQP